MFSVIIPLYNKELSIEQTIRSVLSQTFTDFEIVVVNDGSTDNSLKVASAIKDERIRVIDKANGGVSSARNRGITEAKNEWIAFLDGDDLWMPEHLAFYESAIITVPDIRWIFSGYEALKGNKRSSFLSKDSGIINNVFKSILNGTKMHTSTVCVRKSMYSIWPELFFREGINNSEDREVWYKLCILDKNPYYIPRILSTYCLDDANSLTRSNVNSNYHYLSMQERLEKFPPYSDMDALDKNYLKKTLYKFNKKAILTHYVKNSSMDTRFKKHLSKREWFFYRYTSILPRIFKKIISKL